MCRFVALMKGCVTEAEHEFIERGIQLIGNRSSDEAGFYFNGSIALGFRSLSMDDFEQELQPFATADGQYLCLWDGEIYNHTDLRDELVNNGVTFATNSKMEVIIQLYRMYGDDFVKKLRGMFAIVLYDHTKKRLVAARDPFGIKPLFYKLDKDTLYLASELKVFQPEKKKSCDALNKDSLWHYFTFQYAPEDATVFSGVYHLIAGSLLTYDLESGLEIKRYNEFKIIKGSTTSTTSPSIVRDLIIESVRAHLQAEFEVGTFLSGGIDSTIVASVAKTFNPNIKAFTIGYELESHSEVRDAQLSADALGIDLRVRMVTAEEYLAAARKSIYYLDSPLADPSAVMFYLLSEFAAGEVKACLSGEGADELFGGYPIYQEVDGLRLFTKIPARLKKSLLSVAKAMPAGMRGKSFLERGSTPLRERYVGNAFIFAEDEKAGLLKFKGSSWREVTDELYDRVEHLEPLEQMQTIDIHTWMKGDILLKVDRLSMAHALEVRAPFLAESVFEVAAGLLKEEKINGVVAKAILREAFCDYLPDHMKYMRKRGFPVPLAHWMRTELYEDIRGILMSEIAAEFVNQEASLALLEGHRCGKDQSRKIWTIVMFVLWLENYLE